MVESRLGLVLRDNRVCDIARNPARRHFCAAERIAGRACRAPAPSARHNEVSQRFACDARAGDDLAPGDPFCSDPCNEIADIVDPEFERDQVGVIWSLAIPEALEVNHRRITRVRGPQPYDPRVIRVRLQNNPRKPAASLMLVNTVGVVQSIKFPRYAKDEEIAVPLGVRVRALHYSDCAAVGRIKPSPATGPCEEALIIRRRIESQAVQ